jgi:nucleotide-binding universal stress UspA family protein
MREDPGREAAPSAVSLQRVLVCLDGSALSERSVPHAVAIASALGASVTLLRVLECAPTDPAPADPLQWEMQRREAREYMDHVAAPFRAVKTVIETEQIEGKVAEEICRWCADRAVDLTVATTHGAGGPSPWALASTARKLLDRAPGSLLIVPSTSSEPAEGGVRYRRLLVPLDGSPQAETALPVAERIASAHHAELVIAHVVPVPELTQAGPLDAEDLELTDRLRRRNERVARLYLDRLRGQIGDRAPAPRMLLLQGGDVAIRLASLTETEQVDLIVMSAHGQSARTNTPCGSATDNLIARSSVPLLIVRSRPKKMRWIGTRAASSTAARLPPHAAS